jgi:[ribosomal protein S18]-alanine N-acetyltransferase
MAARLRIRCSRAEDIDELHRIDQICFPSHISFSRAELSSYVCHSKSIARVAEAQGSILGFVLALTEASRQAHVITLDVVPEARRRKIGTMLMEEIHRALKRRGARAIFLEVGTENIPAQRLYEALQYRTIGKLPGYYHGREDAQLMVCLI